MLHEIKLREDYIEPVLSGKKNFEVRLNDRGYQKGDWVRFKAVSRQGVTYVNKILEKATFEITYVHSGLGLREGYVVFGIRNIDVNAKMCKAYSDYLYREIVIDNDKE